MKKKLTLVGVNYFESREGLPKAKLIFVDENEKALVGYIDKGALSEEMLSRLVDTGGYNHARAHEYEVNLDVFNEKMTQRVSIPQVL